MIEKRSIYIFDRKKDRAQVKELVVKIKGRHSTGRSRLYNRAVIIISDIICADRILVPRYFVVRDETTLDTVDRPSPLPPDLTTIAFEARKLRYPIRDKFSTTVDPGHFPRYVRTSFGTSSGKRRVPVPRAGAFSFLFAALSTALVDLISIFPDALPRRVPFESVNYGPARKARRVYARADLTKW